MLQRTATASRACLLGVAMFAGCASELPAPGGSDELSGGLEIGAGTDPVAASYFIIKPAIVENDDCELGSCGRFVVALANGGTTRCGFTAPQSSCLIEVIDWSPLGLSAEAAGAYERRILDGDSFVLEGELIPEPDDSGVSFRASGIWVPGSARGTIEGEYVLVYDNGIRCVRAPCPSLTELTLNSTAQSEITDVDLSPAGASEQAEWLARKAFTGVGAILVGDRYTDQTGVIGRTANQFFLLAEASESREP
ncbi:MAG: DUF6748 domain-containing protein [Kofleriaceae bacterium]